MGNTRTGANRLKGGLKGGWSLSHKTGTGQQLGGRIGGINDIGLLTAPDGTVYAMALMTVPNTSSGDAQGLMQAVTKAVVAQQLIATLAARLAAPARFDDFVGQGFVYADLFLAPGVDRQPRRFCRGHRRDRAGCRPCRENL